MASNLVKDVLACLTDWAGAVQSTLQTKGIFVFGSLIRLDGDQFGQKSDVDLLIIIPDSIDGAWVRADWLRKLHASKETLETSLMKIIKPKNASKPLVSVVAATEIEIRANVHKEGIPKFFSDNSFQSLLDGVKVKGVDAAGSAIGLNHLIEGCLKYAQLQRNKYLGVSANGTESLGEHDDDDPVPKATMRTAAMARQLGKPSKEEDAETDVRRGMDFIAYQLYGLEDVNEEYQKLQTKVSVRSGTRGTRTPVTSFEQLLLAELVFDQALRHFDDRESDEKKVESGARAKFLWSHETVFFAERFGNAFPGIRGIEWFTETTDIEERLSILLATPITFGSNCPIWWWRGENNAIQDFTRLESGQFLMNSQELKIAKIAAVYSMQYFRSFVYVEVEAAEPTGLYPDTPIYINDVKNRTYFSSYMIEEYGIVDGKHLIKLAEFDDGSAKIDGKIQSISGRAEHRARYVTPYNFVISAKDSPITNPDFDRELKKHLDAILVGEGTLEELVKSASKLPKLH
ncbi:hypothetical protein [Burkholderia pyrrocinia]|uniref:hypothetical protein n=1 Tax=Burkholderia pyrrocinia TaxID=60550 RepID=UPI001589F6F2|nr:hypothetical protein [Burkholderia pyrrocinia]